MKVSAPSSVPAGQEFQVKVRVSSTAALGAQLSLYQDADLIEARQVQLQPGGNDFSFTLPTREQGLYTYRAVIAAAMRMARDRFLFDRQRQSEDGPAGLIGSCRQASAMGLGNRAADREAQSNPIGLGCVERDEEIAGIGQSGPIIEDCNDYLRTARLPRYVDVRFVSIDRIRTQSRVGRIAH